MVKFAIALQVILVAYHQITTLFDFFPFNGARFYSRHERALEAGMNLLLMSLPVAGFVLAIPMLMKFGVVYYFVLFAVECATWWAPYFLGQSPKGLEVYQRIHSRTIAPLPRRGANPAPNLEHLILMVLTVMTAIATLAAFRSLQIHFQNWWIGLLVGAVIIGGTIFQFCFQGRKN